MRSTTVPGFAHKPESLRRPVKKIRFKVVDGEARPGAGRGG